MWNYQRAWCSVYQINTAWKSRKLTLFVGMEAIEMVRPWIVTPTEPNEISTQILVPNHRAPVCGLLFYLPNLAEWVVSNHSKQNLIVKSPTLYFFSCYWSHWYRLIWHIVMIYNHFNQHLIYFNYHILLYAIIIYYKIIIRHMLS